MGDTEKKQWKRLSCWSITSAVDEKKEGTSKLDEWMKRDMSVLSHWPKASQSLLSQYITEESKERTKDQSQETLDNRD